METHEPNDQPFARFDGPFGSVEVQALSVDGHVRYGVWLNGAFIRDFETAGQAIAFAEWLAFNGPDAPYPPDDDGQPDEVYLPRR